MRYLVISDIHANLDAFETVMAAAKPLNYDKVLLLGDLVGYGADPNAVCERIRDLKPDADRKSTRLNSSHVKRSRMPSSA